MSAELMDLTLRCRGIKRMHQSGESVRIQLEKSSSPLGDPRRYPAKTPMSKTDRDLWFLFASEIRPRLDHDDDPAFWQLAVDTILESTDRNAKAYTGKNCIIAEIGRCSHWIRPHWKTRAGTAWPYGYGNVGKGFAFASLPEFDWSIKWVRKPKINEWQLLAGQPTRRPLFHRIAIPARTSRHPRATVHTIWTPGTPNDPKHKLTNVYGFEKTDNEGWRLFADWDRTHK